MGQAGAGLRERAYLRELVALALREDLGTGDVTTRAAVPPRRRAAAAIVAKADGVLAGTAALVEVYRQVDREVRVELLRADGSPLEPGTVVARIAGPARSILWGERVALNFLARLCGVATLTRRFVEKVAGTGVRVCDTRKTTPAWRALERAAVRAGGGTNHRFALDDAVLVKSNHVRAAGGWERALEAVREGKRRGLPTEVEVATPDEIAAVLDARPDRILLDNFALEAIRAAVRAIRAAAPGVEIEASGGVTLENVRAIAEAGVDWISVGALTHSAPALDLALRIEEADGDDRGGPDAARGGEPTEAKRRWRANRGTRRGGS
jgi:nicotinate-nucleotide pyrophosphorylase (carboxylating)